MRLTGGCQCEAVRYTVDGEPRHVALCHCRDCQRGAGAPVVAWSAFAEGDLAIDQGAVTWHNSSGDSHRGFCPTCGTGLFFRNAQTLPGLIDVQLVTLDDPEALVPQCQIQTAERLNWMQRAEALPAFDRYPGQA